MTTKIITVPPHLPLSDVIQTLLENRIKRVAVADESGRLLGMVDRDTVLKGLAG
jgi:CBS domain-containing protein